MDYYLGTIELYAFNFAPKGWEACEGQLLPISSHQSLFALIGTTFGGDGITTFALPNLKGKGPEKGMHYCIAIDGEWPPRP